MGLKYTSFVTPLIIIGLILWYSTRTTRFNLQFTIYDLRIALGAVTVFAGVALLVAAPWYLKNWLFTGNPVYPFAFGLFGGQFWDSFRANWYAAAGSGIGFKPATWLALPWLLTLGVRDANYWDGRTGPLLLLFTPLLLVSFTHATRAHRPAALAPLAWFAMAHFAVWAAGVIWSASLWQARLLLPGLAALAPVAGWLWADLPRFDLPRFSLSRFVNLAVGLTLALTLVDAGLLTLKMDPLPYLAGLESRDAFLTRRLGAHYAAMQQINSDLPPTVVVQLLWEPRTYFCARACRPDSILDEFSHLVDRLGAAQAIAQYWRGHGITHVLIHRTGLDFMRRESPQAVNQAVLADLETNWLRPVFDVAGSYQLYKVRTE